VSCQSTDYARVHVLGDPSRSGQPGQDPLFTGVLAAAFSAGEPWAPNVVVDRNVYTGQNPVSSAVLGKGVGLSRPL
jgi:hypothetical protein